MGLLVKVMQVVVLQKARPVKSIKKVIGIAVSNNLTHIYLSADAYSTNNSLDNETIGFIVETNNIKIIGDFNESFSL